MHCFKKEVTVATLVYLVDDDFTEAHLDMVLERTRGKEAIAFCALLNQPIPGVLRDPSTRQELPQKLRLLPVCLLAPQPKRERSWDRTAVRG